MAERFVLKADAKRRIPMRAEPASTLPEWGGAARTEHVTLVLHPPVDFEIAYRVERFVAFLPFASGACDLSVADGPVERVRVRAGSIMFVTPGTCVRARQIEPIEFLVLSVDPEHLAAVAARAANGRPWRTRTVTDLVDAGVGALAREIRRSLLADPAVEPVYLETLTDALVARLVCHLAAEHERPHGRETLPPGKLRRIVRHIEDGLSGPLPVDALARLAGLSRSHFSRAFQAATGDPPQRFVFKRRLCRARDLLGDPALNLAAVAARAGFSSQAHMSTAFRQHLGVTPGVYRAAVERGVGETREHGPFPDPTHERDGS